MSLSASVKRYLPAVATVIGAAAASYAILVAWKFLYPPVAVEVTADAGCDLHQGPCSARFPDGGRVTLTIAPRPIHPITPLTLEVRVDDLETDATTVDFTSPDMNMGFNRASLKTAGPGVYRGPMVLPVCTSDRMTWDANVRLHTRHGNYSAIFSFVTTSAHKN
jgi:hypothetical protein